MSAASSSSLPARYSLAWTDEEDIILLEALGKRGNQHGYGATFEWLADTHGLRTALGWKGRWQTLGSGQDVSLKTLLRKARARVSSSKPSLPDSSRTDDNHGTPEPELAKSEGQDFFVVTDDEDGDRMGAEDSEVPSGTQPVRAFESSTPRTLSSPPSSTLAENSTASAGPIPSATTDITPTSLRSPIRERAEKRPAPEDDAIHIAIAQLQATRARKLHAHRAYKMMFKDELRALDEKEGLLQKALGM